MRGLVSTVLVTLPLVLSQSLRAEVKVVDSAGVPVSAVNFTCANAATPPDGQIEACTQLWAQRPPSPPVLVRSEEGVVRLPKGAAAHITVLDATTGRPVTSGTILWSKPGAPAALTDTAWTAPGGMIEVLLDVPASGEIRSRGYRARPFRLAPGDTRQALLLDPILDVEVAVTPASTGIVRWCLRRALTLTSSFRVVAEETLLDPKGRCVLHDMPRGQEVVGVILVPGSAPTVFAGPTNAARIPVTLSSGTCATARIHGPEGPLTGARLEVAGALSNRDGLPWAQETRSPDDGRADVCGLLAGRATAEVTAKGMATVILDVEVPSEGTLDLGEIRLEPGVVLSGRVTGLDGHPVSGARVSCQHSRATSTAGGAVTLDGLQAGTATVKASAEGYLPTHVEDVQVPGRFLVKMPRGGRIRWPIVNAPVSVAPTVEWVRIDEMGRRVLASRGEWDATTSSARATELEPGSYFLTVLAPGSSPAISEAVSVEMGSDLVLPSGQLERGMGLRGRVVLREDVTPAVGARVRVEPGDPGSFRMPQDVERSAEVTTDVGGAFEVFGLRPGSCRVTASLPGLAPAWREGVNPTEEGLDLGEIGLGPGFRVKGRVERRSGTAVAGAVVEVWEDRPFEFEPLQRSVADYSGEFLLDQVPQGRWMVRAVLGTDRAEQEIEGDDGDTLDVTLRTGGVVVHGPASVGGRPLANVTLNWARSDRQSQDSGVVLLIGRASGEQQFYGVKDQPFTVDVAADGTFTKEGVDPGSYSVSYLGATRIKTQVVVPDLDDVYVPVDFPSGVIRGRTVDPDKQAVPAALVEARSQAGEVVAATTSDETGAFELLGVPEPAVTVKGRLGSRMQSAPQTVSVSHDKAGAPIEVLLRPTGEAVIRGRVEASAGSISAAPVMLVGPERRFGYCDPAGGFEFSGLPAGSYRLCARAFGGAVGCAPPVMATGSKEVWQTISLPESGRIVIRVSTEKTPSRVQLATSDGVDLTPLLAFAGPSYPEPGLIVLGHAIPGGYVVSSSEFGWSDAVAVLAGKDAVVRWDRR